MVFYRKYRPQKIEELDSKEVREKLYSVLVGASVPHAFLFTGPKGLGKTSTARIVAKVVNCERKNQESRIKNQGKGGKEDRQKGKTHDSYFMIHNSNVEPCNKCDQCVSITNGTNIDVLEIDGASNRGIDEIRDLREKVRLAPAAAFKKVYIIDEVHMLTTEAFNALLKTLEEPPNHVIFILCTTEPQKVPETISSRCFQIQFKKASPSELVRSFKRIAEKEKLNIEEEALDFIAHLSDGSFRDGVKILEEMSVFNKKITKELVGEKYQISNIKYQISETTEFLSKKDTRSALHLVSKLVDQGVDMKYFLEQLISELHEMLLIEVGAIEISKINPSTSSGQKSKMSVGEIKELVELLSRAHGELKYAVLPQLPLELAIVEWNLTWQGSPHPLNEVARGPATPFPPDSNAPLVSLRAERVRAVGSPSSRVTPRSGNDKNGFWQELIDKVKKYNHSIAGVLRGCSLKSYDSKEIVIETGYKFHKERLDEKKTMEILEKACKEIAGKTVGISVLLKES